MYCMGHEVCLQYKIFAKVETEVRHNTSMMYFSFLSEIGTVYQRLMLRTPLACISRGLAKAYTPLAAKIDLVKKPVVLNAVMA